MSLYHYAIVEDPDSSWKLDESYIQDPEIRGLEKYRVVEGFRNEKNARDALNGKYSHKKEHMKIVNTEEEREKDI